MAKESKYAEKLRELGFRKTGENDLRRCTRELEAKFGRPLSRQERRKIKRELSTPSFTREPFMQLPITQVTDELGDCWVADGHIDLTHLGFLDHLTLIKAVIVPLSPNKDSLH